MPYYIVFGANQQVPSGQAYGGPPTNAPHTLVWFNAPIGVFRTDTAERACMAAAKKSGAIGTFFAVDGTPWGVELMDVEGATELGGPPNIDDERDRRIHDLERQLDAGRGADGKLTEDAVSNA